MENNYQFKGKSDKILTRRDKFYNLKSNSRFGSYVSKGSFDQITQ